MTRRTKIKALPARDTTGNMRMSTKEFALLLAASENELGWAVATTMTYRGLPLPEPINRFSGKTRQFSWNDCLDFAHQLFDTLNHEQTLERR